MLSLPSSESSLFVFLDMAGGAGGGGGGAAAIPGPGGGGGGGTWPAIGGGGAFGGAGDIFSCTITVRPSCNTSRNNMT